MSQNQDSGIIGGQIATSMDIGARSVVGLYRGQAANQKPFCTGTLIDSQYILTAAHCLDGENLSALYLQFAAAPGTFHLITRSRMPPDTEDLLKKFGANFLNPLVDYPSDIALARFEGALPPGVEIAQLPNVSLALKNTFDVRIYGYGITDADQKTTDGNLRRIEKVAKVESDTYLLFDAQDGRGICSGDSGGPMFDRSQENLVVIGVTSQSLSASRLGGLFKTKPCRGFARSILLADGRLAWIKTTLAEERQYRSCQKDREFWLNLIEATQMDLRKDARYSFLRDDHNQKTLRIWATRIDGEPLNLLLQLDGHCQIQSIEPVLKE